MAWIPQLIVTGGMMGGYGIPDGILQGFLDDYILGTSGHGINRASSMMRGIVNDSETTSWRGKFGLNIFSQLRDYADSHVGSATQDFTLAEITVKNPEGAQYYKQTLAIVVNVGSPEYDETEDYKVLLFTPYWIKIQRREYATPYADSYTSTDINDYYAGMTGCAVLLQGDEEDAHFFFTDSIMVGAGTFSYDGDDWFGFNYYMAKHRWDGEADRTSGAIFGIEMSQLNDYFGGVFIPEEKEDPNEEHAPDPDDPNPGPGGGGGGGGEGEHRLPDDPILIPPLPFLGPASVSWLTVYMMTKEDINEFGQELVSPTPFQQLKQYFNNPLDAIVSIMMVPAAGGIRYAKTPIIHGTPDYTWSRSFMAIGGQYARVNCGIIRIEPYWDSAFDFDPYTRFTIFLPFIGYKTLKADDIMGANIEVEYHIDVCTGDCIAFIVRSAASTMIYGPMAQQVIAQFNGNCGVRVPIGRVSHDAAVDASMRLMSTGIGIAGGAAMAGLGLVDAGNISMSQASNQISGGAMSAINAQKRTIERSGALGGCAGYMGVLKPYLIRQIPRQYLPDNYKELNGYPANKGGTLNHFRGSGYQAIETIELDNLPAYDTEIDEIRALLKGGVLV
jgi:hypothetical protein